MGSTLGGGVGKVAPPLHSDRPRATAPFHARSLPHRRRAAHTPHRPTVLAATVGKFAITGAFAVAFVYPRNG